MSIGIITHHDCLMHDMGAGHPESPGRITAIDQQIIRDGHNFEMVFYDAPKATREQIIRVHDAAYVDEVFDQSPAQGQVYLDPDTLMTPFTLNAALRAAGALVEAVDLIHAGDLKRAFCLVRPPGHHAERNRAMGFCLFNNIMVGVTHAQTLGVQRIAILDFDVHHGNGTQDMVAGMDGVIFMSTFQHPFYPNSGAVDVPDNCVNVPLPAGAGSREFRTAVEQQWLPALERFAPDWIFISAGFDAHREDPLAGLNLEEADYAWVTKKICAVSERHSEGRIVSTLEGGYNLSVLGRSVCAHLDAMLEY